MKREYIVVKSIGRRKYEAMSGYGLMEKKGIIDVRWAPWNWATGHAIKLQQEEAERMAFDIVLWRPDLVGSVAVAKVRWHAKAKRWGIRVL